MWIFGWKGPSGFSGRSTAEEVTLGIDGTSLTAIVTGASSGIGAETARVLALRGVHVTMAVRNLEAAMNIKQEILKQIPFAKINAMELDLSSMVSVRKFASDYNSSGLPLNILINNAGTFAPPFSLSNDKIELQFATNHLGHFLLTNLLLENMKKTSRESRREGRIVNVSSDAYQFSYPGGIRFDKINDKLSYKSMAAYGQSKLANILTANELARTLKEEGEDITSNSVHPGLVATNILRNGGLFNDIMRVAGKYVLKYVVKNPQQGAATQCYMALHKDVKGVSGEYFMDCNKAQLKSLAKDMDLAKQLWDFSLTLTNQN